jgi:hypothetical protein
MAGLRRKNLLCTFLGILGLAGLVAAGAGCGEGHDHSAPDHAAPVVKTPEAPAAHADPNAKAYPLKICVVSGEELGKMGEPMRFTYKGQEIKLCCKGCEKKFHAEADKFLEKIAAASGK